MPMRLVVTASLLETMVEGVEGVGVERVAVCVHVVVYCNHYNKNLNQFIKTMTDFWLYVIEYP